MKKFQYTFKLKYQGTKFSCIYTSILEMNNPWMMLKFYPIKFFLISYLLRILYTIESL